MPYEVVPEDLTAHASHLDGLKDRLNTALSAAQTVSMSNSAYGVLCSFLPPVIDPMEQQGIQALQSAEEGIETTAGNVRTTANDYQDTDQNNAKSLQRYLPPA